MSIITTMLKQDAVYWSPAGVDEFGQPTYNAPIAIRVRWEDKHEEFIDPEGNTQVSNAVVFVSQDVVVKGVLLQGLNSSSVDQTDPKANEDAWEVRLFDRLPNFKATEFLRTAFL